MAAGSDSRRAIAGAIVGLLYGSTLALWSLVLFGSGHATSIPLFLSSAPLGIVALVGKLVGEPYVGYGYTAALLGAPLVWAALGSLVALSGRASTFRLTPVLLLLHYASGLALVATTGEGPAHLQRLPGIWLDLAMWATVYLAGQVALWSWMRAGSASRRAIVGAMVGLLYGSLLAFLSIAAAGGGHGTIVPLLLSSAPLSVFLYAPSGVSDAMLIALLLGAPFLWAALGSLVALPGRGTRHKLTQLLVLSHYASGLALLATRGAEFLPCRPSSTST